MTQENEDRGTREVQENVFLFWKNISETTYQATQRFKTENPEYANSKICFAGRLDPMAQGWLVFLLGDAVHLKDDFIKKDKVYRASVLIGVETDTDDVFGLIEKENLRSVNYDQTMTIIEQVARAGEWYEKTFEQKFSAFSSKHVEGMALFWWATQKRLHEIEIPTHEVSVYDFEVSSIPSICEKITWIQEMINRFKKIEGDFRNNEIITGWQKVLKDPKIENLYHLEVLISASSGMYVRQLVHDIGEEIGVSLTVVEITREQVIV